MPTKTRYTFFIDRDQRAALAAIKLEDGISESEQIRRAITAWLEQRRVGVSRRSRRRVKTQR
jgi:hypothetical protein